MRILHVRNTHSLWYMLDCKNTYTHIHNCVRQSFIITKITTSASFVEKVTQKLSKLHQMANQNCKSTQ